MRKKNVQMSLFDTYKDVPASLEDSKPLLFRRLDEHTNVTQSSPRGFILPFINEQGVPVNILLRDL